jgi:hypothetical protein
VVFVKAEIFNQVFRDTFDKAARVLLAKADEYASDEDRLHNFKLAKYVMGVDTPEQACWAFLTKHLVSIRDMVNSGEHYSPEIWDEKIGDAINYLILLKALTEEE